MTESEEAAANSQVRCVHRSNTDPLFEAARYTFSVEHPGEGFEVEVRLSPIFVTLLPLGQRGRLESLARSVVDAALVAGWSSGGVIRVTPDGTPEGDGLRLEPLLPLR